MPIKVNNNSMSKISVIIITKNEEEVIADCLDSVSFADEIIVVDSGSTDRTVEIAKHLNAKVIETKTDSFAERRNIGLKKARNSVVFYIDADERVSGELRDTIKNLLQKEQEKGIGGFIISRQNYYLGNHPWPKIELMERIFYKKNLLGWEGILHETPQVQGELKHMHGLLRHYTHRNLSEMLAKTIVWSQLEAKLRFDAKHPKMTVWRFPRVMVPVFFDYYIRQEGWRVGVVGFVESIYQSFSIFVTYARLWEMQRNNK